MIMIMRCHYYSRLQASYRLESYCLARRQDTTTDTDRDTDRDTAISRVRVEQIGARQGKAMTCAQVKCRDIPFVPYDVMQHVQLERTVSSYNKPVQ